MQRDSIANTFIVAVSLCVVCAVLVSSAAVGLRTRQDENKKLDKQKNILPVSYTHLTLPTKA